MSRIPIYVFSLLFAFHFALTIYINSSFLSQFYTPGSLSVVYILGAILNVFLLLLCPRILNRFGLQVTALTLVAIDFVGIIGMITTTTALGAAIFFTTHEAVVLMVYFVFDVYLERASKDEMTGRIRSIYLTLANTAYVLSPIISGTLVERTGDFDSVYLFSLFMLIPIFWITWKYLPARGEKGRFTGIKDGFMRFFKDKDASAITIARFVLEGFYAWMVIYMALYLHSIIGFEWGSIGIMFTLMLIPFVLFEIPLGRLSDLHFGEKEILISGFIITAVATFLMMFVSTPNFLLWTALLFITRIGASAIEISSESYFFKHVNARDAGILSLFRATVPASYIGAPVVAILSFYFLPGKAIFAIVGGFTLLGALIAFSLKDTK